MAEEGTRRHSLEEKSATALPGERVIHGDRSIKNRKTAQFEQLENDRAWRILRKNSSPLACFGMALDTFLLRWSDPLTRGVRTAPT